MSAQHDPCAFYELLPASALDDLTEQGVRVLLRALLMAYTGELPTGSRIVVTPEGALWLQSPQTEGRFGFSSGQGAAIDLALASQRIREALQQPDRDPDLDLQGVGGDAGLALLEAIENVLEGIPALAPLIQFDDEQAAILMMPDDADWMIAILPASAPDCVSVLMPLLNLPEDPLAQFSLAKQALRANDLRILGAELSIVVTPETDGLLLQGLVPGGSFGAADWEALLGRMLAVRGALIGQWDDTRGETERSAPDALSVHLLGLKG